MATQEHGRGCYCEVCDKVVYPAQAAWWRWPALMIAMSIAIGGVCAGVMTAWMAIGVVALAPGVMLLGAFVIAPVAEEFDYKPKCPECWRYVDPSLESAPKKSAAKKSALRGAASQRSQQTA